MKGDILFQNVFVLFLIAIILEAAISAIFSLSFLEKFSESSIGKTIKELLMLIVAIFLCFKIKILTIFGNTGIIVPDLLDSIISGLVITRIANFIRDLLEKIKESS